MIYYIIYTILYIYCVYIYIIYICGYARNYMRKHNTQLSCFLFAAYLSAMRQWPPAVGDPEPVAERGSSSSSLLMEDVVNPVEHVLRL